MSSFSPRLRKQTQSIRLSEDQDGKLGGVRRVYEVELFLTHTFNSTSFDREIDITVPNADERLSILQAHTRQMPLQSTTVDLRAIADMLVGFVGADIQSLCREAALRAIRRYREQRAIATASTTAAEVIGADFHEALTVVSPSIRRGFTTDVPQTKWEDIGGYDDVKMVCK
jgi:transitional endoplasmic reticulum ATPase